MAVLIAGELGPSPNYTLYKGFVHLGAGLSVGQLIIVVPFVNKTKYEGLALFSALLYYESILTKRQYLIIWDEIICLN